MGVACTVYMYIHVWVQHEVIILSGELSGDLCTYKYTSYIHLTGITQTMQCDVIYWVWYMYFMGI